jgi:hypothetical protein
VIASTRAAARFLANAGLHVEEISNRIKSRQRLRRAGVPRHAVLSVQEYRRSFRILAFEAGRAQSLRAIEGAGVRCGRRRLWPTSST